MSTWTISPGANERKPLNWVSFYIAFAFCVWDDGRLPSEAEWNYAAAGGDEQEGRYPWGAGLDQTCAVYDARRTASLPGQCGATDIIEVGFRSPKGDGRFGHADLSGNVAEWVRDGFPGADDYLMPCIDCVAGPYHYEFYARGGAYPSLPKVDDYLA